MNSTGAIKKIGFLGNMNNYPFMLARHFKEKGYEIVFILTETEKLCRPEYRYDDVSLPYPEWIVDMSPMNFDFFSNENKTSKFKQLVQKLNTCDLIVLNGQAIRYATYFKPPYLCILTGSDLTILANYNYAITLFNDKKEKLLEGIVKKSKRGLWLIENKLFFNFFNFLITTLKINYKDKSQWVLPKFAFHRIYILLRFKIELFNCINQQRASIRNALGFIHAPKGLIKDSDQLIIEIGVDERKRIPGLMADFTISSFVPPYHNKPVRIFNVARFNWVKSKQSLYFSQLDFKGNDVMIRGLAKFYHTYQIPIEIIFVNKGEDVLESKQLIKELGIDHLVKWVEVLSQKEVYEEYCKADIVFDQLAQSIVSMGGLDAMSVGRPLIANARADIFNDMLNQDTEICDSETDDDVFKWLEKLVLDPEFRINKGKASHDFVLKHFSGNAVINRIEEKIMRSVANRYKKQLLPLFDNKIVLI